MSNTIFTVELPLIKTNEELEKIKQMYPKYDSYFIASGCCKERREKFDKLWEKYKLCADGHFLNQIRTNFHQRTWEMYIGNVLLEKELTIQSQNEGPDFVIDNIAYTHYIECVAPTKGDPVKPDQFPRCLLLQHLKKSAFKMCLLIK
jgi:cellulose synthase/poly-beta-1,6-N-acetylglucosamine synthase-like glycosyltransferase